MGSAVGRQPAIEEGALFGLSLSLSLSLTLSLSFGPVSFDYVDACFLVACSSVRILRASSFLRTPSEVNQNKILKNTEHPSLYSFFGWVSLCDSFIYFVVRLKSFETVRDGLKCFSNSHEV